MKRFSALFLAFALLVAPAFVQAESNAPITVTFPANIEHFHPVFEGVSANIKFFTAQTTPDAGSFDVHPGQVYEIRNFVNGVYVLVGTVTWAADGTYTQT
ncbi:MAG: hypothetical protein ABIO94_13715 [Opitutaceae bacterium]